MTLRLLPYTQRVAGSSPAPPTIPFHRPIASTVDRQRRPCPQTRSPGRGQGCGRFHAPARRRAGTSTVPCQDHAWPLCVAPTTKAACVFSSAIRARSRPPRPQRLRRPPGSLCSPPCKDWRTRWSCHATGDLMQARRVVGQGGAVGQMDDGPPGGLPPTVPACPPPTAPGSPAPPCARRLCVSCPREHPLAVPPVPSGPHAPP